MSGESKQIDEDENGPENGGMKSGPCLIAGFHALSCTSLLSAMDLRAASEQELRECESKWKSLEAEYRARSNI